jgi:S-DNA-T family DNA segregation ATPase FtsK/SpoIIIE
LSDASEWSLWDSFPLGTGEDGQEVTLRLPERNVLLGGEPGGGKSAALLIMLAAAALDAATRLWLLDGKLVELAAWSPLAERTVGPDVGEAIELLEQVQQVMEDRYRDLLATGRRKIEPTPDLPLHVVACDELAFYLIAAT